MADNKLTYEDAKVEIVSFSSEDIVSISTWVNVDQSGDAWV